MNPSWWNDLLGWQGAVWKRGGKLMTGSLLAALALAVGATMWQGIAYLCMFLVTLLICMLISSFGVWRDAKRRHHQEVERLLNEHQREKGKVIMDFRAIEGRLVREADGLYATLRQHNITPPPRPQ